MQDMVYGVCWLSLALACHDGLQDTNALSGTLPREWACLSSLIEIDMSKNQYTGTIPDEWGLLHR